MDMPGHQNEGVDLKSAFAAVAEHGGEEDAHIVLDHEQPSAPPSRECYEVGSGRRDKSSRLQEQTSAAEAAIDFARLTARVELVPFPVMSLSAVFPRARTEHPAPNRMTAGVHPTVE